MKRILLCLLLLSHNSFSQESDEYPANVQTDHAVRMEIAPTTWAPGTIVSRYDSRIAAEVDGRLMSVVDVGDRLNEGDEIAAIDRKTYQLNINEISAELAPLEAELEFYQREADRLEKLEQQNNAARNRLEEIVMNRDQTRGNIRVIRARLDRAMDELSKTSIKAPFPGIVAERFRAPGERVAAGDDVVRLVNTGILEVQARVPAYNLSGFKQGDLIRVRDAMQEVSAR
ncbi:MAG: efflux RND transporter periplasmic adaptor subunit, partial [Gammaproteobacteria bacterium]|nr:efflux RND transporter periplasmic adaptor subunit [Gammaproteobacteria bacterium]